MKYILLIAIVLITFLNGFAQEKTQTRYNLERMRNSNMITTFNDNSATLDKVCYYDEEYKKATVYLTSGDTLRDVSVLVDFYNDYILLQHENVLVISNRYISNLVIHEVTKDLLFKPTFIEDTKRLSLILNPVEQNPGFSLLKIWKPFMMRPNYNPATNIGSKTGSIEVQIQYFMLNTTSNEIFLIPKSKRKFKKMIKEMGLVISTEKLNAVKVKSEDSLIWLVDIINKNN